ncbi:unnamed protein product [Mytilus edulis]|uniref:DUF5641 domain-containing protein n=1 Tax=Mytilus edulis TaxID=6550 RepID=A0A8S3VJK0_MYTED|nr:unnamed protein product [Mytilus edulis]
MRWDAKSDILTFAKLHEDCINIDNSQATKKYCNRVLEIKETTQNYDWKYVPTESNPADLQTRGISSTQFKESTLWMQGPSWISDETSWPTWTPQVKQETLLLTTTDDSEKIKPCVLNGISKIIDLSRFSSLKKLLRVTCYVFKFVNICKKANKRYNHKVTLIEHFAKRWRMEYLTGLREFHRVAGDQSAHVKIGSVVQIMDNSPRMMWKLAVIEDLITGNDGVVRAVKLRTSNGLITTRPIVKLVPLEI